MGSPSIVQRAAFTGDGPALLGAPEEGLAELREATVAYRSVAGVMLCPFLVAQAETELRHGHVDQAEATLADAFDVITERNEPIWLSGVLRAKGDLALSRTPAVLAAVEQFYERSLAIARDLKATSLVLRATICVAKLWCKQGGAKEARELLVPIFDRLTEGFDTPDLIEAKTLLNEIA
jgi:hypothetical protein